ncbi:hypothetical protein LVD17_05440 [Fulvivirga ulvae]|uniref:hypothetical protein n=1 Tax=Fulvivirga ulvae TaxID=2904245 RepID=UPI001F43C05A|nr:hypothetical protein [Fulvivirga ulvae]UII33266.1 hypothetical protein LVD17_05440 [Fulvivirga ulvae]
MKKVRPMTVSSNLVAATINEHPEQSVSLEVKRTQEAKSYKTILKKGKHKKG